MKDEEIKNLALQIVEAEKEMSLGKCVQENEQKIQNIILTLSLEDMLIIDEYIISQNLLTD